MQAGPAENGVMAMFDIKRRLCFAGLVGALTAALALVAAGCGEENQAQVNTVLDGTGGFELEQGLVAAVQDSLTSEDLPVSTGTTLTYLANEPGSETSVRFDLEGPWDLASGSGAATLTTEYIDPGVGPLDGELPEAGLVVRYSWSNGSSPDEYLYQSLDADAWRVHGRADASGLRLELNGASRALLLPLAVGDGWTDSYTSVEDGRESAVTTENTVLSFNEVTVPAGTYDAFLLQTRVTERRTSETVTAIVYTWFAPGVGRVAEIVSLPGEDDDLFSSAAAFYRLSSVREG